MAVLRPLRVSVFVSEHGAEHGTEKRNGEEERRTDGRMNKDRQRCLAGERPAARRLLERKSTRPEELSMVVGIGTNAPVPNGMPNGFGWGADGACFPVRYALD